jgi:hypothetical protein
MMTLTDDLKRVQLQKPIIAARRGGVKQADFARPGPILKRQNAVLDSPVAPAADAWRVRLTEF